MNSTMNSFSLRWQMCVFVLALDIYILKHAKKEKNLLYIDNRHTRGEEYT